MNKLSIIMPCYNCAETLKEAFESIYTQNLNLPFEVVMVDDGSTDNTRKLIIDLSLKYKEVKYFFHEKNKGGGAARNTGIKNSTGDLIFCLDGDNIFYENCLLLMIDCLEKESADGVVIYERRFFKDSNKNNYESHFNKSSNDKIFFTDLFNDSGILLDNFLYKRSAFDKTNGYPENHGFDTQGFEFKFLTSGNKVAICNNSVFLHRQLTKKKKSYFHRVYESGFYSINYYLILEEIIFLFSKNIIKDIIDYDIFNNNLLGEKNIKSFIDNKYKKQRENIFIDNFSTYLVKNGFKNYIERAPSKDIVDIFLLAIYNYKNQNFIESFNLFNDLIKKGVNTKVVNYCTERSRFAIEHPGAVSSYDLGVFQYHDFKIKKRRMNLNPSLIYKILLYLHKKIKNIIK